MKVLKFLGIHPIHRLKKLLNKPWGRDSWDGISFGLVKLYRLENAAIWRNTHSSDTADWTESSSWITDAVLFIISASNFWLTLDRDPRTTLFGWNSFWFSSPLIPNFDHITPWIAKLFIQFFKFFCSIEYCLFISRNQMCSLEILLQILLNIFFQGTFAYIKTDQIYFNNNIISCLGSRRWNWKFRENFF